MIQVTVTLSDWMYRSVVSKSVLTLHRDYFRLRKPLERRVYEIARKHCGRQAEWRIGLETLLKKIGLDLAAPGVPQDDPRHGRRGRAAGLLAWRSTEGDVVLVRARGRLGGGPRPAARGSVPRSTPGRARRRPATIPTGSRRSGCGSGGAAAGRRCGAPRRRSSPSAGAGGPGAAALSVPRAEHLDENGRFRGQGAETRAVFGGYTSHAHRMHIPCTMIWRVRTSAPGGCAGR